MQALSGRIWRAYARLRERDVDADKYIALLEKAALGLTNQKVYGREYGGAKTRYRTGRATRPR